MGNVEVLDAERVQLFIGSREQALEAANWDADQYEVKTIISHRGDPTKRSTLEFLVEFADGDKVWIGYGIGNKSIRVLLPEQAGVISFTFYRAGSKEAYFGAK